MRQDARIDRVRLGVDAKRFGEAPGTAGIEPGDGQAMGREVALDAFVIRAGGFVYDALQRCGGGQPFMQCTPAGFVVGEAAMRSIGMQINIEMCFRHIHSGDD